MFEGEPFHLAWQELSRGLLGAAAPTTGTAEPRCSRDLQEKAPGEDPKTSTLPEALVGCPAHERLRPLSTRFRRDS